MTEKLFTPVTIGALDLKNRIVMAPLTRNRASAEGDAPHDLHVTYYTQRAGAGLIITEATQISPEGKGYVQTPGIYTDEQIAGWKKVTEAVHAKGGKIILQLWHVGRISHVSLQPGGQAPVAPSAINAGGQTVTQDGFVDTSDPRALETSEIPRLIEDYRKAAENAKAAGFDGVEIHAGNGYLLDQFLRDGANKRDDQYGGSIENRARLVLEVTEAVCSVWGGDRVGIRISPFSGFNNLEDSDPQPLFEHLVKGLDRFGLAYLHVIEGDTGAGRTLETGQSVAAMRKLFNGAYMANNCYGREDAIATVDAGEADLVAFGRPYIANPDLAERLEKNAELNEGDQSTFYGGGAEGYVDYPFMDGSVRDAA
ncbi:alkene reductase [Profundibacterium mesophilum]|uniref:NADH-flavin oxidoreductase n=1 Tax=Profundibacterium mesophilum KAUST100406-0324 TaxID=1037889 RepID=A0A921NVH8_9RHOB|nr:alkene reductase [Profundibacterium mesophilum]KAF0677449.1 putative NADH-flavin oxidoreductase [Profundibacterium mesophilum KAUST100406-0324]